MKQVQAAEAKLIEVTTVSVGVFGVKSKQHRDAECTDDREHPVDRTPRRRERPDDDRHARRRVALDAILHH